MYMYKESVKETMVTSLITKSWNVPSFWSLGQHVDTIPRHANDTPSTSLVSCPVSERTVHSLTQHYLHKCKSRIHAGHQIECSLAASQNQYFIFSI